MGARAVLLRISGALEARTSPAARRAFARTSYLGRAIHARAPYRATWGTHPHRGYRDVPHRPQRRTGPRGRAGLGPEPTLGELRERLVAPVAAGRHEELSNQTHLPPKESSLEKRSETGLKGPHGGGHDARSSAGGSPLALYHLTLVQLVDQPHERRARGLNGVRPVLEEMAADLEDPM